MGQAISALKRRAEFVAALWAFYHERLSLDEARAIIRRRLQERDVNFLRLVERIFGNPRSPYLPLLRMAGCQLVDIQDMVRARGLEGTLRALREAGVYISFEEFKGRTPIVRDGRVIPVSAEDLDNPHLHHHFESSSGGSTGTPTKVRYDLLYLRDLAAQLMVACDAHGLLGMSTAQWRGGLRVQTGMMNLLQGAYVGHVGEKWFAPIYGDGPWPLGQSRRNIAVILLGRLAGIPMPWPQPVRLEHAAVVADWARQTIERHGACLVRASVSMAVRVSLAAQERGWDLTGATFMGGGEPPTPGKVQEIRRCGARWIPTYVFSEGGFIGWGCGAPVDGSDVHFLNDTLALIQYPREVPGYQTMVEAFHFTTLLPSAPKLLLNVESDDYGTVESRACGCPLETYGFTQHLREIGSFSKFTGEGITLYGSTLIRILDEVLPSRFGGSSLDYQLMEEEDEHGFSRFYLIVSPKVALRDEAAVIEAVLSSIPPEVRSILRQARTFRVKRMEPVWTNRGKLHPLHLSKRGSRPEAKPLETSEAAAPRS